jgi:hypothetical protein
MHNLHAPFNYFLGNKQASKSVSQPVSQSASQPVSQSASHTKVLVSAQTNKRNPAHSSMSAVSNYNQIQTQNAIE